MENPEWPERLWRKVQDRIFAVQWSNGNMNSLHIPVDIRRFPWIRKLAADYAFQFSSLAPFFSGDPAAPASWAAAIANAQRHPRPRAELSALLARSRSGAARRPPRARPRRASPIPTTVAIVTGQQAGLFGGPLFTLYKGLTAAKLAAQVASEHGVPAVAVFWVEAEDHDWDEVASVLGARCRVAAAHDHAAAAARRGTLADRHDHARRRDHRRHRRARRHAAADRIHGRAARRLRQAYAPGVSMADAFARVLDRLLGDLGVVVFDCSDRAAKPLAQRIFAHEVTHPGRTWTLAGEAGRALTASGYHAQVDGSAQDGRGAVPHRRRADRRRSRPTRRGWKTTRARGPETFSPNVLLRPIVEDALFPTVCYVSGPNELAYLAQLREVYEHFGVPMPLFYPRASATILDSASARFLAKHDLPFEALQARDESALNRLLAASLPESVDRALQEADDAIEEQMAALIASVPAIDPTLEGAAKSTLGKLQHDLAALRGKVISAAKKRDETLRRQFFRAQAQAFPDGIPQERALGSVSLLNRYGPALVQRLVEELPLDLGHHWVLTL